MVSQEGSDQAANAFPSCSRSPRPTPSFCFGRRRPFADRCSVIAVRAALTDAEMRPSLKTGGIAPSSICRRNPPSWSKRRRSTGAPRRTRRMDRRHRSGGAVSRAASAPDRGRRASRWAGVSGAREEVQRHARTRSSLLHDRAQAAAERGEDKKRAGRPTRRVIERTKGLPRATNPALTAALIGTWPLVR
jgi:hypothetical protein